MSSFSMMNHDVSEMARNFAKEGQVVGFFRWEPATGLAGAEALRQGFITAKGIHESLGARVETYQVTNGVAGVNDMIYLMICGNKRLICLLMIGIILFILALEIMLMLVLVTEV